MTCIEGRVTLGGGGQGGGGGNFLHIITWALLPEAPHHMVSVTYNGEVLGSIKTGPIKVKTHSCNT